ncbi:MAG: hypothetical protein AAGL89_17080 [Pseudomonadota bacterium]
MRSGAHDGFARLVVRVPNGASWDLQPVEGGAALRMEGYSGDFDLSGVFNLIDRSFIAAVTNTGNGFDVVFGCPCEAEAFEVDGGFVVIDVSESTQTTSVSRIPVLDWPTPGTALQLPGSRAQAPAPPTATKSELSNAVDLATDDPEPITPIVSPSQRTLADALPEPDDKTGGVSPSQLAAAQQQLAQRVAIAATRGILDPSRNTTDLPLNSPRPQIDVSIFDSSADGPSAENPDTGSGAANLRVTSSSDLPGQSLIRDLESTAMGLQCPDESRVDVGSWGTDLPPMQFISELRAQLFSETDRLQPNIAVELARLYLHFGFGAEARQVLSISEVVRSEYPELVEIALIMEFGELKGETYLARFADCSSAVALWAILAREKLDPSATLDINAALLAITGLPMHLRRFLAPKLSRKLLQFGDEDAAATALRSLERSPEPLTAGAELARAELQMAEGDRAAAEETLADVVASNEQQSAEALIQFVDSHLAAGTLIDEDVATLVEAYAIEMREDPLGAELKRAHVLALAKSGQFDKAFDALDRIGSGADRSAETDLHTPLIGIVTSNAPDVVFLERVFDHAEQQRPISIPAISLSAAQRLTDLGFPNVAEAVLAQQEALPNSARVKELRARIALDLGRASEAEALLFSVEGQRADELRAEARQLSDDFSSASELFANLGNDDESNRNAWLAEDWDRLAEADNGPFSAVTRVIDALVEDSGEPDGMLGRLSGAVSESARAREVIQSLLETEDAN